MSKVIVLVLGVLSLEIRTQGINNDARSLSSSQDDSIEYGIDQVLSNSRCTQRRVFGLNDCVSTQGCCYFEFFDPAMMGFKKHCMSYQTLVKVVANGNTQAYISRPKILLKVDRLEQSNFCKIFEQDSDYQKVKVCKCSGEENDEEDESKASIFNLFGLI